MAHPGPQDFVVPVHSYFFPSVKMRDDFHVLYSVTVPRWVGGGTAVRAPRSIEEKLKFFRKKDPQQASLRPVTAVCVRSSAGDHAVLFFRPRRGLPGPGGVHRAPGRPAAEHHVAEGRRLGAPRHRHAVQRVLHHTGREQRVPVGRGRLHMRGGQPGAQRRVHGPSRRQRYLAHGTARRAPGRGRPCRGTTGG